MGGAAKAAGETAMYLRTEKPEMALLRVRDLMSRANYLSGRWQNGLSKKTKDNLLRALGQLRSMHEVLSPGSKLSRADNARLARFGQEVSDIFSMEQGVAARVAEAGER